MAGRRPAAAHFRWSVCVVHSLRLQHARHELELEQRLVVSCPSLTFSGVVVEGTLSPGHSRGASARRSAPARTASEGWKRWMYVFTYASKQR